MSCHNKPMLENLISTVENLLIYSNILWVSSWYHITEHNIVFCGRQSSLTIESKHQIPIQFPLIAFDLYPSDNTLETT